MNLFMALIWGLIVSYIGLLTPGMMNMTVVQKTVTSGLRSATLFAAGASSVIVLQSFVALTFSQMLADNPNLISYLKKAAIGVFLLLAIFFFYKSRQKFSGIKEKSGSSHLKAGVIMSLMNMLSIPFYFALSTYLEVNGWLTLKQPSISLFVAGTFAGSFLLFLTYAHFADFVTRRASYVSRNINLILSVFFIFLAVISLIQIQTS